MPTRARTPAGRRRRRDLAAALRSGLAIETKPDLTPVTEADRAVEVELAGSSQTSDPATRSSGEQGGAVRLAPLDPRPDRRHAELRARHPGLGHAHRVGGGRGRSARHGSMPSHIAGGPSAGPAPSRTASRSTFPPSRGSRTRFCHSRSRTTCRRSRSARGTRAASATSGRTCSSRRRSRRGGDAIGVNGWDLAAMQVIVEEAGGRFFTVGSATDRRSQQCRSNGLIHDELLAA